MAGLYIHIPFCKSRCIYCAFYSTTSLNMRQRYVDALCQEMVMRNETGETTLDTIYLGGGTPSQLTQEQLRQLFLYIYNVYGNSAKEITIEMNPDDVTKEYAETLKEMGVNRVSMGAQTFDDGRLRFLHRRHTAQQVRQAVSILREAGLRNISIDLMYGFPNETLQDWQQDIENALSLDVEHISAYCLMIEEGTRLYEEMKVIDKVALPLVKEMKGMRNERNGESSPELSQINEELERQMYEVLTDQMTKGGYGHYEISNFAKPGFRSCHNSSYWNDVPYIGLGAAAHSYDLRSRSWNVDNIGKYVKAIESGERPAEYETIDEVTHYNDRITTALRTSDGLDLTTLPDSFRHYCLKEAERYIGDGLLRKEGNRLMLTRKGLFVSDMVMSGLIYV